MKITQVSVVNQTEERPDLEMMQADDCRWWAWTQRCLWNEQVYENYVYRVEALLV